jgi:hypothetical protein
VIARGPDSSILSPLAAPVALEFAGAAGSVARDAAAFLNKDLGARQLFQRAA